MKQDKTEFKMNRNTVQYNENGILQYHVDMRNINKSTVNNGHGICDW